MSAQNRDQPGMEMVENEYANFAPPEQSTNRVRNNEKLETMIRETNKSVQGNRKLMWMSLIFTHLIFAAGFVALHFSVSAKVEIETRRALQTTLLEQFNSSTGAIMLGKSLAMWKAMNANDSGRLTATNNNIESLQTTLTALKDITHHNLTEIVGILHRRENQEDLLQHNLSVITGSLDRIESGVKNTKELLQNSSTNSSCDLQLVLNDLRDMKETLQHNMTAVESGFSILQENLTSRLSLSAMSDTIEQCPIQRLLFFDTLSNSASSIFPRRLSNYYRFKYDGNNGYSIDDGGGDMYDTGNKLKVWCNSDSKVQVNYNSTYYHPQGYFAMVCKALHPFVLSMLVSNPDGSPRTYYIEESSNLGADGSGSSEWNTGSLLVGSYNIHYALYQVYGANDPSIIQIFFTVSSQKFSSTGCSSLRYVDYQRNTDQTHNRVYMSGTAHNVFFNYILTSTTASSSRVSTGIITGILIEIFQGFSA